jgi:preprotein translocase subunit SecY
LRAREGYRYAKLTVYSGLVASPFCTITSFLAFLGDGWGKIAGGFGILVGTIATDYYIGLHKKLLSST